MAGNYPEDLADGYPYEANFGESSELSDDDPRPRIILMGTKRSGKSSIQKVVFYKTSPHETLFLVSSPELQIRDINTSALIQLQLLDFPGNFDFRDQKSGITPEKVFKKAGALVFVIDAQDDETYSEAYEYFFQIVKIAYKENPKLSYHVLIHKVDGDAYMNEDHKSESQSEIKKAISDELAEAKLPIRPSFHLTSIYDHTIFEAFSQIIKRLSTHQPYLGNLVDGLVESCNMEKAFLFDVVSKLYVATDHNPVDMRTYELCSDMIDVVIDVSCIYGLKAQGDMILSYDDDQAAVIKLTNGDVLYLREVGKYLALVCLMRSESFSKSGLVEYNFQCFKKAIGQLFEIESGVKFLDKEKSERKIDTPSASSAKSGKRGEKKEGKEKKKEKKKEDLREKRDKGESSKGKPVGSKSGKVGDVNSEESLKIGKPSSSSRSAKSKKSGQEGN